jgi:hypothetical protein
MRFALFAAVIRPVMLPTRGASVAQIVCLFRRVSTLLDVVGDGGSPVSQPGRSPPARRKTAALSRGGFIFQARSLRSAQTSVLARDQHCHIASICGVISRREALMNLSMTGGAKEDEVRHIRQSHAGAKRYPKMMRLQNSSSLSWSGTPDDRVIGANGALQWPILLQDFHQVLIPLRAATARILWHAFDSAIVLG